MTAPFTWSYSSLKAFETCPSRFFHYSIAKDVKEPESPQLREGHALHEAFEKRIKSGQALPDKYRTHEPMLARIAAAPGETYAEQKLALTAEFMPSAYFAKDVWFRTVIDAAKVDDDRATVIDYKTGKISPDMTQLKLIGATMFHHMPRLNTIKSALVFVNYDHVEQIELKRGDLPKIWGEMLPRVKRLKQARDENRYPPKPSGLCRNWCAVKSCEFFGRGR